MITLGVLITPDRWRGYNPIAEVLIGLVKKSSCSMRQLLSLDKVNLRICEKDLLDSKTTLFGVEVDIPPSPHRYGSLR
jgi:hypothetical protein